MILIAVIAALAAACTWVVLTFAFDDSTSSSAPIVRTQAVPAAQVAGTSHRPRSIVELTPAQLFAGTLGGYAVPRAEHSSTESVLASMSPQTRRYTERILNLTFEQLAAGAAGQP